MNHENKLQRIDDTDINVTITVLNRNRFIERVYVFTIAVGCGKLL